MMKQKIRAPQIHKKPDTQSGNIFFMLFASIALIGAMTVGAGNTVKGIVTAMSDVTRKTIAEEKMQGAARISIMNATVTQTGNTVAGDCDADGMVEPLPYRDAGTGPHPVNGGYVPENIGAEIKDPWGSAYGYCAWDLGTKTVSDNDAGCGGNTALRIDSDAVSTKTAVAIISAGKDRKFSTTCNVTKTAASDCSAFAYNATNPVSGGCFYSDGTAKTRTQAKSYCQSTGGHMANITTSAENTIAYNLVTTFAQWSGSQDYVHLGGNDTAIDGTWVFEDGPEAGQQFSNGAASVNGSFVSWASGEPDGAGGETSQVYSRWDGGPDEWIDIPHHYQKGYLCEKEATTTKAVSAAAGSDDIVMEYTYDDANGLSGDDLWKINDLKPGTAKIDKDIDVAGGADLAGPLNLMRSGLILPSDDPAYVCDATTDQQLRINYTLNPAVLEICDFTGGNGWIAVSMGESATGPADCTGLGDSAYNDAATGHCYYLVSSGDLDQPAAQASCASNGAYLAVPSSPAENALIVGHLAPPQLTFIGINETTEGNFEYGYGELGGTAMWAGGGSGVGGSPVGGQYSMWSNGEPDNSNGDEACVAINFWAADEWVDYKCFDPGPYLCEKTGTPSTAPTPADCAGLGDEYYNDPASGHCYYKEDTDVKNWDDAKTACEAAGDYLVVPSSATENDLIRDNLPGGNRFWAGWSDAAADGTWKYVGSELDGTTFWSGDNNGSPVGGNYSNWLPGNPEGGGSENCGALNAVTLATWTDDDCGSATAYTCERDPVEAGESSAPTAGLVGYWPFETSANAGVDASGNGHNTNYGFGPDIYEFQWYASGKYNGAAVGDGSPDGIRVPHDNALNTTSFTLSAWINSTSAGDEQIVNKWDGGYHTPYWFMINGGKLECGYSKNNGSDWEQLSGNAAIPAGSWTHVACSYDNTSHDLVIYVNGVEDARVTGSNDTPDSSSTPVWFGWVDEFGVNETFQGLLDEIRIYDRALSPSEITDVYNDNGTGGGAGGGAAADCSALGDVSISNPATGHCYFRMTTPSGPVAALAACNVDGAYPVEISDATENAFVYSFMAGHGEHWLGATDVGSEGTWKWIHSDTQFWQGDTSGNTVNGQYANWHPTDGPDNWNGNDPVNGEDYLLMYDSSGLWNDDSANTGSTVYPLCEKTGGSGDDVTITPENFLVTPGVNQCTTAGKGPLVKVGESDTNNYYRSLFKTDDYLISGGYNSGISAFTMNGDGTVTYLASDNDSYNATTDGTYYDGTYYYAANAFGDLLAYTFDGTAFTIVGRESTPNNSFDVTGYGNYLFVADETAVRAYRFDGNIFTLLGQYAVPSGGEATNIWTDGKYIYATMRSVGMAILTFDGTDFTEVVNIPNTAGWASGSMGDGKYLYVDGVDAVIIYTFDGTTATQVGEFRNGYYIRGMYTDGTNVYSGDSSGTLNVWRFNGIYTEMVDSYFVGDNIDGMVSDGTYLYVARSNDAMWIFSGVACQTSSTNLQGMSVPANNSYAGKISVTGDGACAIKPDGSAWCWGSDSNGQIGNGATTGNQASPSRVIDSKPFVQITGSDSYNCGIHTDGTGACWGADNFGRLGNGATSTDQTTPVAISGSRRWSQISAGKDSACGIDNNGAAYCWGANGVGQVGNSATGGTVNAPTAVSSGKIWSSISVGEAAACGIDKTHQIWCWGANDRGRLGSGEYVLNPENDPVFVRDPGPWSKVSVGREFACGIKTDGSMWCWGDTHGGDLATPAWSSVAETQNVPMRISDPGPWTDVSAATSGGKYTACGIKQDGTAWCWGEEENGSLGNGGPPDADQNKPSRVLDPGPWATITRGDKFACGFKTDGSAWCWGHDGNGALGNGTVLTAQSEFPTRVANFPNVTPFAWEDGNAYISATGTANIALGTGGTLGYNAAGYQYDCNGLGTPYLNDAATGHCYYRSGANANWTNAQASCNANGGYLAAISSASENNKLFSTFGSGTEFWAGWSDATTEGVWVFTGGELTGQQFWTGDLNGITVGGLYNNWNVGVEPNGGTGENCGTFVWFAFNVWHDSGCSNSKAYICEIGTAGYKGGISFPSAGQSVLRQYDAGSELLLETTATSTAAQLSLKAASAANTRSVGLDYVTGSLEFGVNNAGVSNWMDTIAPQMEVSQAGNVGIGTSGAVYSKLQINGGLRIGTDATPCNSLRAGTLRYVGGSTAYEYCNGTAWTGF